LSAASLGNAAPRTGPLLEALGIAKAFPGVQALLDVSLTLHAGEVVAVVGENGAGKSTFMKILGGVQNADAGTLRWDGQSVRWSSVHDAERLGIVLIHQELNLAENLDVAANVFLGREPTWGGPLRLLDRAIYPRAQQILQRLGLNLSPSTPVGQLSMGQQQLVEIARALSLRSRVLIMDEPTSSLTQAETERLFLVIKELKASGVAILYISHRLREIVEIADRAVVLRDGRLAGTLAREELTPPNLIRLMVGRDLKQLHQRTAATPGPVLLQTQGLRWSPRQIEGVTLEVRAGEILGLAGLIGAGRSEWAETLLGLRPCLGGTIHLGGKPFAAVSPSRAMAAGLYLVPEDRRLQGLILPDSVMHNASLAALRKLTTLGLIRGRDERALGQRLVQQLSIRTPSLDKSVGLLSGGNQQKVVIAKGLAREPKVLILDEPTRGVDVGAKREIYAIMDDLARQGVGIVMISSDMEEVLGMSDRIAVMHAGRISGTLAASDATEEAIMTLATGGPANLRNVAS
jgi:ribose transport system ATP-binding protein